MTDVVFGGPWHPVRRLPPPLLTWVYWGLAFYVALVLLRLIPGLAEGALLLAPFAALTLILFGQAAFRLIVVRLPHSRPAPTPPPPEGGVPTAAWQQAPRLMYPSLSLARGQCGWVALRCRAAADGKLLAYQIVDQAPNRVFEREVVQGLIAARAPAEAAPEFFTVISFVTAGPDAPDWAHARLSDHAANPG